MPLTTATPMRDVRWGSSPYVSLPLPHLGSLNILMLGPKQLSALSHMQDVWSSLTAGVCQFGSAHQLVHPVRVQQSLSCHQNGFWIMMQALTCGSHCMFCNACYQGLRSTPVRLVLLELLIIDRSHLIADEARHILHKSSIPGGSQSYGLWEECGCLCIVPWHPHAMQALYRHRSGIRTCQQLES